MILADTSIWIEFLKKNKKVFDIMQEKLEKRKILAIECIFGELLQGTKNKQEQIIITSYWEYLPKVDESGIWVEAGIYSGEKRLASKGIGLIDVVILLLARRTNSKVWTLDKKLQNILGPSERYVWTRDSD